MKSIFVLVLSFIVIHGFGQGQSQPAVKQFLNGFVNRYERGNNLYFKPTVDIRLTNRIVNVFEYKDTDSVFRDVNNQKVFFAFSPDEKELIKKTWLEQTYIEWDSALLERASIFREKPIHYENFTREQRNEYLKQFEGKHIILFSSPVFLRNSSLCIFFYANGSGGTVYIMRKETDKWVKYLEKVIYYV